jgi:hypothetical protein
MVWINIVVIFMPRLELIVLAIAFITQVLQINMLFVLKAKPLPMRQVIKVTTLLAV